MKFMILFISTTDLMTDKRGKRSFGQYLLENE